jgi:lipopolysaccharide biosynthesis regulator YciM
MQCPYCHTENREDRERCYACDKDISMLRLLVNKARHHYNDALEHAERGRTIEAIDELRNALDLDRRFTNAHVVLGTLYAKNGEYQQARECWSNALKISPEMEKAHSYLQRVQAVETSLPALKSYRWLSLALGIVLLGLAAALLFALKPDPAVPRLRAARQLYQEQKYGKALKELEAVRRGSDQGSAVNLAADSLRLALKADLNQQVRLVQELKFNNHYKEAVASISALEASQPDNETSSKLALLRQDIAHYYQQDIERLYQEFQRGSTDYDTLKEQISQYLAIYPDGPERVYFREYLDRAADEEAGRQITQLRQEYAANPESYVEIRRKLSALVAKYPGSQKLKAGRTDLIDEMLSRMFGEFETLVTDRQFARAEQLLADIEDCIDEFRDVVDVSGPAELAHRVLADARKNARFKDIRELIQARQWEDADLAIWLFSTDTELTPAEQKALESNRQQVENGRRQQRASAQKAELQAALAASPSDEEASATLLGLNDALSSSTEPTARQEALVKAAAAAAKLGKRDALTSVVATLKDEGVDAELVHEAELLMPAAAEPAEATPAATPAATKGKRPGSGSAPSDRRPRSR